MHLYLRKPSRRAQECGCLSSFFHVVSELIREKKPGSRKGVRFFLSPHRKLKIAPSLILTWRPKVKLTLLWSSLLFRKERPSDYKSDGLLDCNNHRFPVAVFVWFCAGWVQSCSGKDVAEVGGGVAVEEGGVGLFGQELELGGFCPVIGVVAPAVFVGGREKGTAVHDCVWCVVEGYLSQLGDKRVDLLRMGGGAGVG